MVFTGSANTFTLKLSIKLQENNFLLWNQHVKGVIQSHKFHKTVVNHRIQPIFRLKIIELQT